MKIRAILALVFASVGLMVAVAPAATAAGPYPPSTCRTLSVSTTTPLEGGSLTVTGENFAPNAQVRIELHTTVSVLATVTSDGNGSFSTSVTLPAGVTGTHRIVAVGGNVAGCPDKSVEITIQANGGTNGNGTGGGSNGGTAFTGVDIALLLAIAAGLLGIGVLLNRRSKPARARARARAY